MQAGHGHVTGPHGTCKGPCMHNCVLLLFFKKLFCGVRGVRHSSSRPPLVHPSNAFCCLATTQPPPQPRTHQLPCRVQGP